MLTKEQVRARIVELKSQQEALLREREALRQRAEAWVAQNNAQSQQVNGDLIALSGAIAELERLLELIEQKE